MTEPGSDVVSTAWLAAHLGESDLRVVDATWYLPNLGRHARAEFRAAHVPGAVYFDIDRIADPDSPLPHMLPTPQAFAAAVSGLGIDAGDRVVAYGGANMIASARAWWMFRVFGHERVSVLDGGLRRWREEGRAVESGEPSPPAGRFRAGWRPELVADLERVRANLETRREQVVDARARGRFLGREAEPRPGLRGGHIPDSLNLPYDALFARPAGLLCEVDGLRRAFAEAGIDVARPVVTTCGSGVSAAVLALGLAVLGQRAAAVYDGSWSEWGARTDTPIDTE